MSTPATATAVQGTSAGRPQPQTTAEPQGGPFIRHAPKGRRPIYDTNATYGQYFGPPIVAAPGWYTGYRLQIIGAAGASGGTVQATQAGDDAPESIVSLLQVKDAWGTNLLSGPGQEMLRFVQMLSGQFGVNAAGPGVRDPWNLPSRVAATAATGAFTVDTRGSAGHRHHLPVDLPAVQSAGSLRRIPAGAAAAARRVPDRARAGYPGLPQPARRLLGLETRRVRRRGGADQHQADDVV